jgi:hypothetical protein
VQSPEVQLLSERLAIGTLPQVVGKGASVESRR